MTDPTSPAGAQPSSEQPLAQQSVPQQPLAQQPVPQQPMAYVPPPGYPAGPPAPASAGVHKLSSKIILAVAAGVAIVSGGTTAAVALTGHSSHTTPPPAPAPIGQGGVLSQPTPAPSTQPSGSPASPSAPDPAQSPIAPAPADSTSPAQGGQPAQGSQTGGQAVTIAGNVAITPAAGWSVANQQGSSVILTNSAGDAELFVTVGRAQSSDIGQDLQADIQGVASNFSGLQLGQPSAPQSGNGTNFTQAEVVRFTGGEATQQGTVQVTGIFNELLNPNTGLSAFLVLSAQSDSALQSAAQDADAMVSSML